MAGSLTIPNVLANIAGPANANLSLLDANWNQIRDYVNAREIAQDTFAARPAAGTAGRWFFATDTGVLYAEIGGAWVQVGLGTLAASLGETLTGLGLSNNGGDATNDIDIAVGAASSEDAVIANRNLMSLTSALTKQLDAAWAVGTNAGGRMSAAAIANTTYFVHLIKRLDTGIVDVGFDVSATAPTLPANYTRFRRIGAILREAGAIVAFIQDGDFFQRTVPILQFTETPAATTAITKTALVPIGINVIARFNANLIDSGAAVNSVYFSDLATTDAAPNGSAAPGVQLRTHNTTSIMSAGQIDIRVNTSGQYRYRALGAAGTLTVVDVGWFDRRGRG